MGFFSGFRDWSLARSSVYKSFKYLISSKKRTQKFVDQYLHVQPNSSILDLGCGVGDFCKYFVPESRYLGIDSNRRYIETAQRNCNDSNATFLCGDISTIDLNEYGPFDLVMMSGVMHHLDSSSVIDSLKPIAELLSESGRFFAIEPVFEPNQPLLARLIIASDRGQYVRDREGYSQILSTVFNSVNIETSHDIIRIPYTHALITASKPVLN